MMSLFNRVTLATGKMGEEDLVSTTASDKLGSILHGNSQSPNAESLQGSDINTPLKLDCENAADVDEIDSDNQENGSHDRSRFGLTHSKITGEKINLKHYGKYIMSFYEGRCFGELALMSENATRNASIIAEEESDLLIISRELYNETLKAFQQAEYASRRSFVLNHPLFVKWHPRFQRLLEMSLTKEIYPTGRDIIKQGDITDGLVFLTRGHAKLTVEPQKHTQQYGGIEPISESLKGSDICEKKVQRVKYIEVKRKDGYVAAEKINFFRSINVCIVASGDVLGDIEAVLNLKTYMMSAIATDEVEVFILNAKNYERLIMQKNPSTIDLIKMGCELKLKSRLQSLTRAKNKPAIPFFRHSLLMLSQSNCKHQSQEKDVELLLQKKLPHKKLLFEHLTKLFSKGKAELIEPIVPGSIYIKDVMRHKAIVRKSHSKSFKKNNRSQNSGVKYLPVFARSNKQIMLDIERQKQSKQKKVMSSMVKELRSLEVTEIQSQLNKAKKTPGALPHSNILNHIEPGDRRRVYEFLEKEMNIRLPVDEHQEAHDSVGLEPDIWTNKLIRQNPNNEGMRDPEIYEYNTFTRTKTFVSQIRSESQPDLTTDVAGPSFAFPQSCESEKYYKLSAGDDDTMDVLEKDYILPQPLKLPQICNSRQPVVKAKEIRNFTKHTHEDSKETKFKRRFHFVNEIVRSRLNMAPENPLYRDWETGEISISCLEKRIAKFNEGQALFLSGPVPKGLPKLTRFAAEDGEPVQPKPGGKVLVQRKGCSIGTTDKEIIKHNHIRFHMVSKLPKYEKLRRSRLLMQLLMNDVRSKYGVEKRHLEKKN